MDDFEGLGFRTVLKGWILIFLSSFQSANMTLVTFWSFLFCIIIGWGLEEVKRFCWTFFFRVVFGVCFFWGVEILEIFSCRCVHL